MDSYVIMATEQVALIVIYNLVIIAMVQLAQIYLAFKNAAMVLKLQINNVIIKVKKDV